jgi:transposase, IS6 family
MDGGALLGAVLGLRTLPPSTSSSVPQNILTGLPTLHTCVFRWVQVYSPELNRRCRPYLRPTNKSYRVDETYLKVNGQSKYLYRAVDSSGQTIDFLLVAKRDAAGAKRFFREMFQSEGNPSSRVINVDKNAAYPIAIRDLKTDGVLSKRPSAAAT